MAVILRRNAFVFFENLCEIAAFGKAAFGAYGSNRQVGAVQQEGCVFDAVEVYIIHRSLVGKGGEELAKILWIHTNNAGHFCGLF